ncbi:hypothetical protein BJX63DRAFT_435881 [Aspergillus granulosus]|uniref:Leucine-rich repeat domain-containing protein n=1 Tax=Aspergillus granulosus TaxID=176169 RepID=A0ABR4H1I6_9EURO
MPTLPALPPELLFQITSHINNQKDILNIASTTQPLHALLYAHAFTSLTLDDGSHYQLTRLTHVLARNPRCARAVRVLRFEPELCTALSRVKDEKVRYDPSVILPLLERVSSTISSSDARANANTIVAKWEELLKAGDEIEPWVALILSLVPNVEELSLTFYHPSFYIRKLFSMMNSATSTLPNPNGPEPPFLFSRLHTLSARWYDTEYGVHSSYILPFFRLPSLRTFNGVMVIDGRPEDAYDLRGDAPPDDCFYDSDYEPAPEYEDDPEGYFRRYPGAEAFSNVTHIRLGGCNSQTGFPDLIRACRGLVSFVYEHGDCGGVVGFFAPRRFYASLWGHRGSLEEVEICFEADSLGMFSESGFIGSFKEFQVLRRLRVTDENILVSEGGARTGRMGTGVLPASLENLVIEDFDACDDPGDLSVQLKELRREVESQCPKLVSLRVAGYKRDVQLQEGDWPQYLRPTMISGLTAQAPMVPFTWCLLKPPVLKSAGEFVEDNIGSRGLLVL